jgi:hypothetical protein
MICSGKLQYVYILTQKLAEILQHGNRQNDDEIDLRRPCLNEYYILNTRSSAQVIIHL